MEADEVERDKVVDADIEWADDNPLDATVGKERDGENAGGGRSDALTLNLEQAREKRERERERERERIVLPESPRTMGGPMGRGASTAPLTRRKKRERERVKRGRSTRLRDLQVYLFQCCFREVRLPTADSPPVKALALGPVLSDVAV